MVRARHLKQVLEAIDRVPRRQAIRARIGVEVTGAIEAATGTDWLPVALDVALAGALDAELGPQGLVAFNQGMMRDAFRGPLLRALVEAATHVLGLDAGAWARWVPKAWGLMFRDCGHWTVARRDQGESLLTLSGLPPVCAGDAVWPVSVASALSALLPAVGSAGTVRLESLDLASGTAVYCMRWGEGPPGPGGR
jgi:hypothetical protein